MLKNCLVFSGFQNFHAHDKLCNDCLIFLMPLLTEPRIQKTLNRKLLFVRYLCVIALLAVSVSFTVHASEYNVSIKNAAVSASIDGDGVEITELQYPDITRLLNTKNCALLRNLAAFALEDNVQKRYSIAENIIYDMHGLSETQETDYKKYIMACIITKDKYSANSFKMLTENDVLKYRITFERIVNLFTAALNFQTHYKILYEECLEYRKNDKKIKDSELEYLLKGIYGAKPNGAMIFFDYMKSLAHSGTIGSEILSGIRNEYSTQVNPQSKFDGSMSFEEAMSLFWLKEKPVKD